MVQWCERCCFLSVFRGKQPELFAPATGAMLKVGLAADVRPGVPTTVASCADSHYEPSCPRNRLKAFAMASAIARLRASSSSLLFGGCIFRLTRYPRTV